jgi:hypothetical protein
MTAGHQDAGLRAIGEIIDRDGVHLQFVPQPMALESCWYTIGLAGRGHPELIIFGLPPDVARPALHSVAGDIIAGRRTVRPGQHADDVLEGHQAQFVPVSEPERHLPAAALFYAGTGTAIRALQIVWPDRYGRWPWQTGTRVADMPVLGAPA